MYTARREQNFHVFQPFSSHGTAWHCARIINSFDFACCTAFADIFENSVKCVWTTDRYAQQQHPTDVESSLKLF